MPRVGQALSAGILMARQSVTVTAGAWLDEKQTQARLLRRAQVLDNPELSELERWTALRRLSVANGDMEAAKIAGDVIDDLRELETGEAERTFQLVNDVPLFVDESGAAYDFAGKRVLEAPPPAPADPLKGSFREDVVLGDGQMHTVLFSANGVPLRDLGVAKTPETEDSKGDPALANTLDREIKAMSDILADRDGKPFGLLETEAAKRGLTRALTSADVQKFNASAQNVLSLIVRSRSGAQATDAEVKRLESFAVPLPGDSPETVRSKFDRLRAIVSDLRGGQDPFNRVRGGSASDFDPDEIRKGIEALRGGN